jgi:hypothetical protein
MVAVKRQDTPVAMAGDDGVEVRVAEIGGDMSVSYIRIPKGTDFSVPMKGLQEDMCQCPHWGFMTKGKLKMRTPHGDEVYEAGDAYYWAPGHVPEALEDTEFMEFSPADDFAEVIGHVKEQMS